MSEPVSQWEALERLLGVTFKDKRLLKQAMTHASYSRGKGDNYERLEFLGDAALGLAVAHFLYEQAPRRAAGEYSAMRAAIVNRTSLSEAARKLGIAPFIRLGKGEEQSGGRERPGLLEDCLEALIGAVYVDQGWDATRQFVEAIFADSLRAIQKNGPVKDYKTRLTQYCQAQQLNLPCFEVLRETGPDHQKEFEVVCLVNGKPAGTGKGFSKKMAEQEAAREALRGKSRWADNECRE